MSTTTTTASATTPAGPGVEPRPLTSMEPLPTDWRSLGRAFVATARRRGDAPAVADSTGVRLSYAQSLLRSLALGRCLSRRLGHAEHVGVLMPPTVPGAVANLALTLWGKVPVNLNYTASQGTVDSSVRQAGLTHVLTARKVLDKIPLRPSAELVLLEDLKDQVTTSDKAWAAAVAKLAPVGLMGRLVPGLRDPDPDATATVIFTSGSTGDPKGVVLTHRNILANSHQIRAHIQLRDEDVILGVLPFFHSFGYTVPLWTVLTVGLSAVYHPNPLDARIIGRLAREFGATILLATPTFARNYQKKCEAGDFGALRLLILGAEKLNPALARELHEAWGVEPLEGYGCTETGPVVSVNRPQPVTTPDGRTVPGNKPGTIGTPMPGTSVKTIDPENEADLPPGDEGLLCVRGPQVMRGYLDRADATARVLRDGWYNTGDLGFVDPDGFLTITGRLSRFSKIGGEMVPHVAIEDALKEAAGTPEQVVAVTSLSDPKRGERLAVLYTEEFGLSPQEAVKRLQEGALPKLWIPSTNAFVAVEEIPILGTGKLDLRGIRELARERLDS